MVIGQFTLVLKLITQNCSAEYKFAILPNHGSEGKTNNTVISPYYST